VTSSKVIYRRIILGVAVCLCILAFAACEYEAPITPSPTRNVEERLLGDWVSLDGKEQMKTRRFDDNIYIVYYDGDLFRAYHSDVAETPFVSVQDINSNDRKYAYVVWKLSDDGKRLTLRNVKSDVIPKRQKDSARIAELLEENEKNPELFGEEIEFNKEK
jgi:lipopolysaccharide export LptBFGC system permease protein LptF